jgi:flagellin
MSRPGGWSLECRLRKSDRLRWRGAYGAGAAMIGPLNPWNSSGGMLARRALAMNSLSLSRSLMRLAGGDRIFRAAEDPAGLIASENLRSTLAMLDAEADANHRAVNQADTADAALGEVSGLLTEAKRLVSANANDAGLSAEEKAANQLQIDSILTTVDRISSSTSFNGRKLLDGSGVIAASGKSLAVGSSSSSAIGEIESTESPGTTHTLADLRSGKPLNLTTGNLELAGQSIDRAISDVATQRGRIGAFSKHTLQTRISGIESSRTQLGAALSVIRDVDYAAEVSRTVRFRLLERSSSRVLGIANRTRGSVLSILA